MTLCIAGIAFRDNRIITVSDYMLSNTTDSIEVLGTAKVTPLSGGKWVSVFAGHPGVAAKINKAVHASFDGKPPTAAQIRAAYQREFQAALKHKIEDLLLGRFGLTMADFLKKGHAAFGDGEFSALVREMSRTTLDTEFVVAGFEPNGAPALFSVGDPFGNDPATVIDQSHLRFCAIGTGAQLANASLFSAFPFADSLGEVIYRLAEAKYRGERAPGVGPSTLICTLDSDGNWKIMMPGDDMTLKMHWEQHGRISPMLPRIDETVDRLLLKFITKNAPDSQSPSGTDSEAKQ